MPDTLITSACGCVIRGGIHTYETKVFTVEVHDSHGDYVHLMDVDASDDRAAERSAWLIMLNRMGTRVKGWGFDSIGFAVMRKSCCKAAHPCRICAVPA